MSISITNNGLPIPEEAQKHIFDPFFTTKEVGKGVGLGLSISYQIIVEKHGGEIFFNSCLDGVEFVIKIPIQHSEKGKILGGKKA